MAIRDRDQEVLEQIALQFNTTPEELIEGTSDVNFYDIPDDLADAASLCPCRKCGAAIGCEYDYCHSCP